MTRVLIVEDEPQILRALRINMRARNYDVEVAPDGGTALRLAASHLPDIVVLDLGLPDMDGVDVIKELRGWTGIPIIVLSGRAGSHDKVTALDAGADDYVTKPFGVDELLARIRAVTRRLAGSGDHPPTIEIGRHTVDLTEHVVQETASGKQIRLSPTEWALLGMLIRNPGKLISQRQLLHDVWGAHHQAETHYLRQYMTQLRRKLEDDPAHPRYLLTEPGMGYRFRPATENAH